MDQDLPESLTLDYKEQFAPSLVDTVACMANTYGGLVLVGVTDNAPRQIVGVPEPTVTQIVNACHDTLEPPWEPEIIPVPIASSDLFVLVVRVDPSRAPRPLLIQGRVRIRLQGRNATADRARLAQLFSESPMAPGPVSASITPPQLPRNQDGLPTVDFMMRSGLSIPVDEVAAWRPLSDRGVDRLTDALNTSRIRYTLSGSTQRLHADTRINEFHRRGFNRARDVRLVWQGVLFPHVPYPFEAIATAHLPGVYGAPATGLQFILDVQDRARKTMAAVGLPPEAIQARRISVPDLYLLLDAIVNTLTDPTLVAVLADLAGIDPAIVPQPAILHLFSEVDIHELLDLTDLHPIPDVGISRGANLLADPALDLANADERRSQVDNWLQQIALDAGLRGMEDVLARYHQEQSGAS